MMQKIAYAHDKCIDSQLLVFNLVALFDHRRLDIDTLLRGTQIFKQDLQQVEYHISPLQLGELIDNALRMWPGNDLAFLLGQQWLPSQSGYLTNGLLCCKHLPQMQVFWQRHHWHCQPWLQGWRWRSSHSNHLLLQLDLGCHRHRRFFIELTLSSLVSSYKRLSRHQWQGQFALPFPKPNSLDQYYKYLGEALLFDQPVCVVSYDSKMNEQQFEMANRHGYLQANHLISQKQSQSEYQIGLPGAIRLLLLESGDSQYSLPAVAMQLSLSPATLKRRLKEYQFTFQQLQDEANLQKAIYLLAISGETNLKVAKRLNFADGNNFRRSFKRWTGQLPSQFKYWLAQN